MSIALHNFRKHGHTSFDVLLPNGQTMCAVFQRGDAIVVALLQKDAWQALEWDKNKANELLMHYHMRVHDIRIVKSGWFAFATVDFDVSMPLRSERTTIRGKTDKGFAEFLVSIVDRIEHD